VLTGSTSSLDFPTTPGAYDTTLGSEFNDDAFITVIAAAGDTLLWSSYLGGTSIDRGFAVILDAWGNPVLTGPTYATDFPTTPGAYDSTFNGGISDVFVANLDITGTSGVIPGNPDLMAAELYDNTPNPFSVSTVLRFYLPGEQHVSIKLYDVRGTLVRTLADGVVGFGSHRIAWDSRTDCGTPAAPGVYFCRMQVEEGTSVKKIMFLK
jgi:hypothetical protein